FEGSRTDKHVRDHEVYAVGDSEAALLRAKRGVAQRAMPAAPRPKPAAPARAWGLAQQRALAAASAFLRDRRKVTIAGSVLGVLIVALKPAGVKVPTAAAPAVVEAAAQDAPAKVGTPDAAAADTAAAKPAPAK